MPIKIPTRAKIKYDKYHYNKKDQMLLGAFGLSKLKIKNIKF